MCADFLGVLPFVVAGLTVRPRTSGNDNVLWTDRALWLQLQLLDDDQKLSGLPPQGPTRTADLPAMLEKADTRVEEWRRVMPNDSFPTGEELVEHIEPP